MKITPMTMTRTLMTPYSLPLSMRPKLLLLLLAACMGISGVAQAAPSDPTVVNGQVTFSQQGNVFSITNSPNAIINWGSFSIAQGEIVRFLQQSGNSAVLNRITGQDPSRIMGALQSNGRVYLINPNGILFGGGAQINVNGLVASTLDIGNADFIAGKNKFFSGATAGSVVNEGAITTPSGGKVFLIAPDVTNSGLITSPQGEVVLAAGHSVQLADSSNPGMHVVVSAPEDQAINIGEVIAQGGKIGIYGALVNQRGTLNANSAVVGENGKIILKATRTTLLEAGSLTTATGAGNGGEVQVLGEKVGLMGDALLDVSGQNGGGTALIGGDYQGKNAAVMNAEQVFVGKDAVIKADAIASGDGGKVIVWGNQTAQVYGSIFARGGAQSGNGGFIETSSHYLDVAGIRVNAGAANGKKGQWLLDPENILVAGDGAQTLNQVSAFASLPGEDTEIDAALLSIANADVILQATHNITFYAGVNNTNGVNLTAQAGNNIIVQSIVSFTGDITLAANHNGAGTASGTGIVNLSDGIVNAGGIRTITDYLNPPVEPPVTPPTATTINQCVANPTLRGCSVILPPTQSFPPNPVQQALNSTVNIINTVTTNVNPAAAQLNAIPKTGNPTTSTVPTPADAAVKASAEAAAKAASDAAARSAADAAAKVAADAAARAVAESAAAEAVAKAMQAAANQAATDAAAKAAADAAAQAAADAAAKAASDAAFMAATEAAAKAAADAAADAADKSAAEAKIAEENVKQADEKKAADKTDTKEVASNEKTGTKNEPVKKMYCN
ncbi:filamentous hemagglutinin N-terminal domain-containing protein [Herminiimonas aquatilis]|uniref:Filamentous hemagglutinin N-terminal domain-containing protein n=1 Tax=Herminiimonas aquatilis TaxID=345342 RepID=A0ABW2J4L3_9BURK